METLVVADTKMIEYHGSENIEKYVLTVMNMVSPNFLSCRAARSLEMQLMRHKGHWACHSSFLVRPQQISHQTGCSHPHVFSAALFSPSASGGWFAVSEP